MPIDWYRDFSTVLFDFTGALVFLVMVIALFWFYLRFRATLNSVKRTAQAAEDVVTTQDGLTNPWPGVIALVVGIAGA